MTQFKSLPILNKWCSSSLLVVVLLTAACNKKPAEGPSLFTSIDSTQTHINFINQVTDSEKLNILDYLYFYNGGGVATGDINKDGLSDIYFISNSGKNRLYLNKGNFQFEDITEKAGVGGFAEWSTGVTMADVNADGLLDIYVCTVGDYKGLEGANELYINNGDLTFTEQAARYGLDFTGFATQATFFDYDKDSDLDMYLLNHAVHTSRSFDKASSRNIRDNLAGDRLYRNDTPRDSSSNQTGKKAVFTDVSEQAGIFGPAMAYGLGISVGDLNNDGWDDIYVSNDFHEDDYYYINQGDGTFKEGLKDAFGHVSRFSMGNDMADINNDGFLDIVSLDMYPEDEKIEKASMGEDPLDIFLYKLNFGFQHQYSRNTLQLNVGGKKFSDIGLMAGMAATDWSWSPLLADYDNDGIKDLFITNGVVRRPNDLDYTKYISTDSVARILETSKVLDQRVLAQMAEGKAHNYLYKGTSQLRFEDKSAEWGFKEPGLSNGAAYADLDNDGDLDLVTNNINSPAGIYRNHADSLIKNNFLRIQLQGKQPNTFGIGAKLFLKTGNQLLYQHQMPTRGFLSSVDPILCFGVGKSAKVDSLFIIWPDQKMEIRTNISPNTTLTLKQADAQQDAQLPFIQSAPLFEDITQDSLIAYRHQENSFYDFNRENLIPFRVSTEGPALAVGDVNGDGLDDLFVGGGKHQPGKLFTQQGKHFMDTNQSLFRADSVFEDVDAVFFDANGDKALDLYVVTGGNEFFGKSPHLLDRLYMNDGQGNFTKSAGSLPPMYDNKSCVKPYDFDSDGDVDLFVGGRVVGYKYGKIPNSYLLINDGKGNFTDQTSKLAPGLRSAGMTTDAAWADYDRDGDTDLIVLGDWMPVTLFENQNNKLVNATDRSGLGETHGFWSAITAADFDSDGDIDLLAGNLGTNTKFRKRIDSQLKMYVKDIDNNQTLDHILAYSVDEKWYPVAYKDELGKQLPLINKRFTSYKDFAGKTVEEIFEPAELQDADLLKVNRFESVYLENTGNKQFSIHSLPVEAQVSKITAFHLKDVDGDKQTDVLLGGNFYGASSYQGRYDASYGLILKSDGKGNFRPVSPAKSGLLLEGEVRSIATVHTAEGDLLLVARNNMPVQVFRDARKAPVSAKPLTTLR